MVPPQAKEKIKRRIKLHRYYLLISYHILSALLIISYHRYKEETVEELNVERAPLLPSFVMEESDTVEVSSFYNSLSLSLSMMLFIIFLITTMLQSHCGIDTIHFSLSPKMVVLIKIFY